MEQNEQAQHTERQTEELALTPQANAKSAGGHFTQDRDYLEALRDMQQGQWERVVPTLRALQERYPDATEINDLLQEATFRANLESNWGDKVKGMQGFTLPIRPLLTAVPILVLGALLVIGVIYYGRVQRVNALSDQQQVILEQAQSALAAAQYREALDLFGAVLAEVPEHVEALKGQNETKRQMQLANDYQLALDRIAAGNYKEAMTLLLALQEQAPGYRDVANRIEEVKVNMGAPQLFADAEFAFGNELWLSAISQYEDLRRLDSDYEAAITQQHLATAYFKAGQQMLAVRPSDSTAPKQAKAYFEKAEQMDLSDGALPAEKKLLESYLTGERLVNQNEYEEGANYLFPIFQQRPDYFGGYVAELLYRAYIGVADRYVQTEDLAEALAAYQRAVDLGLDSNGIAAKRVAELNQLIAPPTTVPAPVSAGVSAPVAAIPTPAPVVTWQEQYRGWIAFRSNRDGGEATYIMRGDGSEAQLAPPEVIYNMTQAYQQQQWSPDGVIFVYVKHVSDQASTNIFKVRSDLPSTWDRDIMLTDYVGTEYDPVWSPDGQSIVFVSNHTGNDEIWSMNQDGGNQRQLTYNDWPWDKHPSFSPDGKQIVFYSNRSGNRQIWVMNSDGSNQVNISSNSADEWEPSWIR
ncbi:MAG: DPP IV N-terminal domain-containing protein [Caldilineaceae bacterium]